MAGSVPWNWRETHIEWLEHIELEETSKLGHRRVTFAPAEVPQISRKMNEKSVQSNRIDCLCKAMNTHIADETCLGVLVDELQRQHRITIRDRSHQDTAAQTVSLKSLLDLPTRLEKRDRLALGVKLASVSAFGDCLLTRL